MADRAAEMITSSGITMTFYAATAGAGADRVPPGVILLIKNASGSGITVNLLTQDTVDGNLAVTDRTSISVPATTGLVPLRVPTHPIYQDSAGLVPLTWSAVTTVTFAVLV